MQSEINIAISGDPPAAYFEALLRQCENRVVQYGGITYAYELRENLRAHGIPRQMEKVTMNDYDRFLKERRLLMAAKIRDYYNSL